MSDSKQRAYELIERLAPIQLAALIQLLEAMIDPFERSLASAPVEEEQILPETAAELDAARASIARGEGISHEEILRQFGAKRR